MFARRGKRARADCEHVNTVSVRNAGIERTVCEICGHVSLKGLDGISGTVSRSQFERASEKSASMV